MGMALGLWSTQHGLQPRHPVLAAWVSGPCHGLGMELLLHLA